MKNRRNLSKIKGVGADTTRHDLYEHDELVQTFEPDLSPLQQQILQLAGLPLHSYTTHIAASRN